MRMKKFNALKELRGYSHCVLTVQFAKRIASAFGDFTLAGITRSAEEFRREIERRGNGGEYYSDRPGITAHELAELIAMRLSGFTPSKIGLGSRLRSACDAIEKAI